VPRIGFSQHLRSGMDTPTQSELLFNLLGISEQVLKALTAMGYKNPTEIQAKSIPVLLQKKDFIGQARTGTGKTVAFGIPVVESIDAQNKATQAIILCPTRELALQVAKQLEDVAQFISGVKVATLVGGQPIEPQMRSLRFGAQIVVGTPGRVIDHLDRKTLQLDQVHFAVLDEADEMLDMGFRDDIETILKKTPATRQTALFSATMPTEIKNLAKEYQKNPEHVNLVVKDVAKPLIEQIYYEIPNPRKSDLLASLLDIDQPALSIAFCNTIQRVDELTRKLQEAGYSADALHGDMRQSRRDRVMDRFRTGDCKILVATDVAARGIDVAGIDVVFNVDLPLDQENYVHRIGRTGRAGRTGKAYSFVGGRDRMLLKTIARNANGALELRQVPSQEAVESSRAEKIFTKIATDTKPESHLEKYIALIKANLGEVGDPVKLAASLLKNIIHKGKPIQTDFSHSDDFRREGGRKSFGSREDRPERSFNRRREFGNREDRPERSFGNREDRPERSFGKREDRPFRGEGRPFTPRSDFGDRPRKSFEDKGNSFGNREFAPRREGRSRFEGNDSFGSGRSNWKKNDDHGSQPRFGSRRQSDFSSSRREQA